MSYQQSIQQLSRLGVQPALDVSTMGLPDLKTRQDVDALGARGLAEMEQHGHSHAYLQWQRALQLGLDERLPDLEATGGTISRSIEELAADAAMAQANSAIHFVKGHTDPFIEQLGWGDMEVNELRDRLSVALVDAPDHERGPIMKALSAIDNSGQGSISMGISWEMPEDDGLTIEVNSGDSSSTDAYSTWRNGGSGDHGLEGLAIRPSIDDSYLNSGITSMNPDGGGTYEVASDWALAAAIAAGSSSADTDD